MGSLLLGGQVFAADYAKTKYPLVMAHGMFGFNSIAGVVDYWYQIPQDLRSNGATVFVTQVAPLDSSEARGEQLLKEVQDILAISGAAKVNLVGHSHGSHSVRYVAAVIPQKVASVTAVGGPVKGSPVADLVLGISNVSPALGNFAVNALNALGSVISLLSGNTAKVDAKASLQALSLPGSAAFNEKFPAAVPSSVCGEGAYQVNGVRYYSWSGSAIKTNILDPSDLLVSVTGLGFQGVESDGLVGRCSSHLGMVIRDNYKMNHLDEVNQMLGLRSLSEVDPKSLYRQQANRLKLAGL